ncbi:MAG: sigma-70 family RNA polymerase sigma factor [Pseudomonadota bacterium]|jgi:RNA polymerase sigma factor (sigma-70 family)|nr:sigma-70 family RNA polymerase sigma factor [Pseudomonadota bacterium]MEC8102847.1 sigma-70 family RNA polymerase sigma factor [Pseudomonadota bacterium]MEE2748953.1 sigma-70 family RNA polymerase sigma factor [Pseudomonadota bacterium]
MDKITDELIVGAQAGDSQALDQLLYFIQPNVRDYAMKHCVINDVEDAVQEVLLTVSRRLETLRIVAALSSWVFTTTRRECRRLGRTAFDFDPHDDATAVAWLASTPEQDQLIDLGRAIERLPDEYRQVLLMKDYEHLTNKEIAEQTGITVAAVKSRLHRARTMVRESLLGL